MNSLFCELFIFIYKISLSFAFVSQSYTNNYINILISAIMYEIENDQTQCLKCQQIILIASFHHEYQQQNEDATSQIKSYKDTIICQQCLQRQTKHFTLMSLELHNYGKVVRNIQKDETNMSLMIKDQQQKWKHMQLNDRQIIKQQAQLQELTQQQLELNSEYTNLIQQLLQLQQEEQLQLRELNQQIKKFVNLQQNKHRVLFQHQRLTKRFKKLQEESV